MHKKQQQKQDNMPPPEISNLPNSFHMLTDVVLPSSLLFQESTPHTYGTTPSSHDLLYKKLPQHHHHDGCLCQYTRLSGDTWKESRSKPGLRNLSFQPLGNLKKSRTLWAYPPPYTSKTSIHFYVVTPKDYADCYIRKFSIPGRGGAHL